MNGASGTYGYKRMSIVNIIGVPEEEKAGEAEKVLKRYNGQKKIPKFGRRRNYRLEAEWTLNRIN